MERMLAATAAAEETHAWFRSLRRIAQNTVAHALNGERVERIVDCGAGTGRNLDWLGRFGTAVGVEITPLAIAVGRQRGRNLIRGTVTSLPFPDQTFDIATSFDVLYCLDDRSERDALAEMWRVLKPGGLVVVNAAAFRFLRGSHSALTHEVRRYTRRSLATRLEAAGFAVRRTTYTNAALFLPTLGVRAYQRFRGLATVPSESDLDVPAPAVNWTLDRLLAAEARLLRHVDLPFGTSVLAVARKPRRRD